MLKEVEREICRKDASSTLWFMVGVGRGINVKKGPKFMLFLYSFRFKTKNRG